MAKHSDSVLQRNALKGAITTWCPACGRKSALSAWFGSFNHATNKVEGGRKCRYCGHFETRNDGARRKLYEAQLRMKSDETYCDCTGDALAVTTAAVGVCGNCHKPFRR